MDFISLLTQDNIILPAIITLVCVFGCGYLLDIADALYAKHKAKTEQKPLFYKPKAKLKNWTNNGVHYTDASGKDQFQRFY